MSWKEMMIVGIGGFWGAFLRTYLFRIHPGVLTLFLINTIGCFLLVFFIALWIESKRAARYLQLFIATGFLGAFTTFSGLIKQSVHDVLFLILSLIGGVAAALIGLFVARRIGKKGAEDVG